MTPRVFDQQCRSKNTQRRSADCLRRLVDTQRCSSDGMCPTTDHRPPLKNIQRWTPELRRCVSGGHRIIPMTRRMQSELQRKQSTVRRVLAETQRRLSEIEDMVSGARMSLSAIGQELSIIHGMQSASHHLECRRRCKVYDVHDRAGKTHCLKRAAQLLIAATSPSPKSRRKKSRIAAAFS